MEVRDQELDKAEEQRFLFCCMGKINHALFWDQFKFCMLSCSLLSNMRGKKKHSSCGQFFSTRPKLQ